MSKDTNRLMGHADEADGIEEYDNPLPDWWLGLFWLCIIWAFGYAIHYHFIANRSQEARFEAEMAAAAERWPAQAAEDVVFAVTPEAVAGGEEIYYTFCFTCHGQNLEGGIGQSFLDDVWLHGGTPEDVIHTIVNGVPEKGMIPWGSTLSAEQINHVAAFVLAKNAEALGIPVESIGAGGDEGSEGGGSEGSGDESGIGS
ncbi:MAG: cbb3-type cytochrome c oxidase N-terminal domain-containing protein [Gemmatimonadota bacterium]